MSTITKIQTPDGTVYDLAGVKYVYILDDAENSNATFNITNFSGYTELITGSSTDYSFVLMSRDTEYHQQRGSAASH